MPDDIAFLGDTVSQTRLAKAALRADRLSCAPFEVLIAEGAISASDYVSALAMHLGLSRLSGPVRLLRPPDIRASLRYGINGCLLPSGEAGLLLAVDADHVRTLCSGVIGEAASRLILCTREEFETLALAALSADIDRAISDPQGLLQWRASAAQRMSAPQGAVLALVVAISLEWALQIGSALVTLIMHALALVFALPVALQLWALLWSRRGMPMARTPRDCDLPVYTVLAPMHREEAVAGHLVDALSAIDYPREKLEIIILLEADDQTTAIALRLAPLPAHMRILHCPAGSLRTKPRALNLGLMSARGACLTVYDAEDSPAAGQLREAAALLAGQEPAFACVQAPLLVDNGAESWIARMFALEYAGLFLAQKPGAAALDLPVPLGGTSNHFRTELLRDIGGWDARNVTEDADLGHRLYRLGHRIGTISAPTLEEAPISLAAWLGQRRRWLKGWFQTALVQSRRQSAILPSARAGRSALGGLLAITHALSPVLYPVSLLVVAVAAFRIFVLGESPPLLPVLIFAGLPLIAMLTAMLTVFIGARRANLPGSRFDVLLIPAYLLLVSAAGMLAAVDFARTPFHWRKTQHGLSRMRGTPTPFRQL